MPKFPGGEAAMMNFISKEAKKNSQWADMGLSGTIYVQFIVNADGNVSNVEAVRGSYDLLKKTAVNAVKSMPKWTPGMQDGHAVPVILVVPISFKQI
jgi:protein TonB